MLTVDHAAEHALSQHAVGLRKNLVEALRDAMPLRKRLMDRGSLENPLDLERAFLAQASVGRFNREHPEHRITVADLIQIVPAIGSILTDA